jgi:hypothetical protein
LFVSIEERVECVKKFLLRTFFAAEELNVVNAKQIGLAIAFAEFDQVIVLNRVDEFVDEKFARKINHLHVFLFRQNVLADRLHQVRLAKTDAAVDKKRVVSARRRLRHSEAGRMRDFIIRPDHEGFKCVARIESKRTAARRSGFAAGFGLFCETDGFDFFNRRFGGNEFNSARFAQCRQHGRLKRHHVVTLNPILVDVVRHAKTQRLVGGAD